MAPLPPDLRKALDDAVVDARETAEAGAANALAVLAVEEDRAPDGLSPADRALRVALRARARSLGNGLTFDGMAELREEIAYATWHRMLFARFLAENGLLVEPASRAPVSMEDVAELARELGEPDPWVLAARYAAEMLPGIFGTTDPTTQVVYAPDDRLRLEAILRSLPVELFTADDALGWVYQFWQTKRKKEVNAADKKVGGADLAPVTQLFTEHYMVRFLLENSLGAWWAGRHPDSPLLSEWEYLRYRDDRIPAAGTFEGWPERAAEITVMDPCMGSGHFLVAAGDMLRRMRMEEEDLTAEAAAEAVLRDNLYGLELDPRCTQLGAFALAFDAWKAAGGYRELPVPNIACSGIAVKGQLDDWRRLAGSDTNLRAALERLYELFQDAPELGSLINPRSGAGEGLWAVDPDRLLAALDQALAKETEDPAAAVFGAAAQGTAKAARLLGGRYLLATTNVPYLKRGNQGTRLQRYCEANHPDSKADLATVVLERMLRQMAQTVALVSPQSWLYQAYYRGFRRRMLREQRIPVVAMLGAHAFEAIGGEIVNVTLTILDSPPPGLMSAINSAAGATPSATEQLLRVAPVLVLDQRDQLGHPDAVILVDAGWEGVPLMSTLADAYIGLHMADNPRFRRGFWEVDRHRIGPTWRFIGSTVEETTPYSGRGEVAHWKDDGAYHLANPAARIQGRGAWGRPGVLVSLMGQLKVTLHSGELFDNNTAVVTPRRTEDLAAIWSFCSSPSFDRLVRQIDRSLKVTNASLTKVPFDLEHWTKVAAEQYPDGLPEPHSDDPTQWLFKGTIVGSEAPLQVAVARLLGYRWPDQQPDELDALADPDGIVCLPPVGEAPAAERLERLLATAYGSAWSPAKRTELLAATGGKATTLEAWLRDEFFEQHTRLFHNRPFIWQVWDGRKDGFSALLHYHRLDHATLAKVTYAQLGDWLERQRAGVREGEAGADSRLTVAQDLQTKLAAILAGEPPHDIYVRWKPLADQPIGWEPDLDDGVRLNIRPFVTAGVLRTRFTINWNKDRGTDPDGSERLNDRHYTVTEKRMARQAS